MTNITQTTNKSKRFIDLKKFANDDWDTYSSQISKYLTRQLMSQILSEDNEKAYATLSSVDRIGIIPGIGDACVPINEFAKFCDVPESYLYGILTQNRFIRERFPHDIASIGFCDILVRKAPIDNFERKDKVIKLHYEGPWSEMCVNIPNKQKFLVYSPRVVLAVVILLSRVPRKYGNKNISKVADAVKRKLSQLAAEEKEERETETVVPDTPKQNIQPAEGISVTSSGEFVVAPELLARSIKVAIKEALSEMVGAPVSK